MVATEYDYLERITRLAKNVVDTILEKKGGLKLNEVLSVCFSYRVVNSVESVAVLVRQGLMHDAKSILRTISEALIWQQVLLKREDALSLYDAEHVRRQHTIVKKMRGRSLSDERFTQGDLERTRAELKRVNKVDLRKLADDVGLLDEYYTLHNCFSSEVHHLPRTMGEYLKVDASGVPVGWIPRPSTEDSQVVIVTAFECLLRMSLHLNDHYKLNLERDLLSLDSEARAWFEGPDTQR